MNEYDMTVDRPKATSARGMFMAAVYARPDVEQLSAFEQPLFIATAADY